MLTDLTYLTYLPDLTIDEKLESGPLTTYGECMDSTNDTNRIYFVLEMLPLNMDAVQVNTVCISVNVGHSHTKDCFDGLVLTKVEFPIQSQVH